MTGGLGGVRPRRPLSTASSMRTRNKSVVPCAFVGTSANGAMQSGDECQSFPTVEIAYVLSVVGLF